jgi:hypothetical protein
VPRFGALLALYSDRDGIFTKADPEDPKPTQVERALLQLHIELICARSPQAKGRLERLFQTLQDRMCKALRGQGIDTSAQANTWLQEYLGEHKRRFAVEPALATVARLHSSNPSRCSDKPSHLSISGRGTCSASAGPGQKPRADKLAQMRSAPRCNRNYSCARSNLELM